MPSVQDTYTDRQPAGFEGMKVNGEEYNAVTRIAEDAAGLHFGRPVMRGAIDAGLGVLLMTVAGAAGFVGVSVRDVSVRPSAGDMYPKGGNVTVLTQGAIWVRVTGAVAPGNPARFDTVTNRFTTAAASGTVGALPATWEFDSAAADGGLAILVKRK